MSWDGQSSAMEIAERTHDDCGLEAAGARYPNLLKRTQEIERTEDEQRLGDYQESRMDNMDYDDWGCMFDTTDSELSDLAKDIMWGDDPAKTIKLMREKMAEFFGEPNDGHS